MTDLQGVDSIGERGFKTGVAVDREVGDVRWTKMAPGSTSTISVAGTRLSEQPIQK